MKPLVRVFLTACLATVGLSAGFANAQSEQRSSNGTEPVVFDSSSAARVTSLLQPVMTVTPNSIFESLYTGEQVYRDITIANAGSSDLEWSLDVSTGGVSGTRIFQLGSPDPDGPSQEEIPNPYLPTAAFRYGPMTAELGDLTGVRILFDQRHATGSPSSWTTLISDLEARGATVVNSNSDFSAALLADIDVLWLTDMTLALTEPEIAAVTAWAASGHGILFEGDQFVENFNSLLDAMGAGFTYSGTGGQSGFGTTIYPHPTTTDVDSIYITSALSSLTTVVAPAGRLVDDPGGQAHAVYSNVGPGRIVAVANETFYNGYVAAVDNRLFGNQVFDWLAGNQWMSAGLTEGTLGASQSVDVPILLDANRLDGGDYEALVTVTGNDPVNSEDSVAVTLQVTASPVLEIIPDSLPFGDVFVGQTRTEALLVSNTGTDQLIVSAISSGNPQFQTTPSSFSLDPHQQQIVLVEISATTAGPVATSLTFTSNVPFNPAYDVPISCEVTEPPDIAVSPGSLSEALTTGDHSVQQLTLENLGVTDLIWTAFAQVTGGPAFQQFELPPVQGEAPMFNGSPLPSGTGAMAELQPLNGTRILLEQGHGAVSWSGRTIIISELRVLFGAQVDIDTNDVITDAVLEPYDIYWLCRPSSPLSPAEYQVVADWVHDGGGLLLEDAFYSGGPTFSTLLAYMSSVIRVTDTTYNWAGITTEISPHQSTLSIDELFINTYNAIITDTAPPHQVLVRDVYGTPAGAIDTYGDGHVMVFPSIVFENSFTSSSYDNRQFCHQSIGWLRYGQWLDIAPASGVLSVGPTVPIDISFDATGLYGGDHTAVVQFVSNDPDEPALSVPVTLSVTGAPDIAIEQSTLGFGGVYLTSTAELPIRIDNIGTDTLEISSITTSDAQYAPAYTSIEIGPAQWVDLPVTFTPAVTGVTVATITINSNDTDSPALLVNLVGEGVPPPDIAVSPDSIHEAVFTNDSVYRTLTIENTGSTDLHWTAASRLVAGPTLRTYDLAPSDPASPSDPALDSAGSSTEYPIDPPVATALAAELGDLTGVSILYDRYHSSLSSTGWSTLIGDLSSRGATFEENTSSLTAQVLADHDVLWLHDMSALSSSELTVVDAWLKSGHGLLLEGDESESVYNTILSQLGAGIVYGTANNASGYTTLIYPHETTEGVSSIYLSSALANLSAVQAPAGRLVDDALGAGHAAYSVVGSGRIVALTNETFSNGYVSTGDNRLFGNQVFDWLGGYRWLTISPTGGQVAPSGSETVDVNLDATGLYGGTYSGAIDVTSDDPDEPIIEIPVRLDVTGVPDIMVNVDSLIFPTIFAGGNAYLTALIKNVGTDDLTIADISADIGDFSPDPTSGSIIPNDSILLIVTFNPVSVGEKIGTLAISSDDPDTPIATIGLRGTAIAAPDIAVSPDSLESDLFTNQTEMQSLTIYNQGGSDLEVELVAVEMGGSESSEMQLPSSVLSQLFARHGNNMETQRRNLTQRQLDDIHSAYTKFDLSGHDGDAGLSIETNVSSSGGNPFQPLVVDSQVIFFDDVESGNIGWSTSPTAGAVNQWSMTTARASSGASSWMVSPHAFEGGDALISPPIDLTGTTEATLTFMHYFDFDDCEDPAAELDGGVVEISTDNGASWIQISPIGEYPWVIDQSCGNPLEGHRAYAHALNQVGAFTPAVFDLSGFADNVVRIRFHAGWDCGNCALTEGWYIDDVLVFSRAVSSWLTLELHNATIPPDDSVVVGLLFDATGLYGGDYYANVHINTNDPDELELSVPAHLHVTGTPDIVVSPTSLDYGLVPIGHMASDSILVQNIGTDDLIISSTDIDSADFSAEPLPLTVSPEQAAYLRVLFAPVATGVQTATLTINSNDADQPQLAISAVGQGFVPPEIALSADSFHTALLRDESDSLALSISNLQGIGLEYSIEILTPIAVGTAQGSGETPPSQTTRLVSSRWTAAVDPEADSVSLLTAFYRQPDGTLQAGDFPPIALIEDFENTAHWPWWPWYQLQGGGGTVEGCAYNGDRGLSNPGWSVREDVTTALPGDKLSVWVKPGSRAWLGFGARFDGCWSVVAAANLAQLRIESNQGWGFQPIAVEEFTFSSRQWYRLEAEFGSDGFVVGRLFDADGITLLASVSVVIPDLVPGGLAIRGFGGTCFDDIARELLPDWLTVTPMAGVLPATQSDLLEMIVNATDMRAGDYLKRLVIHSNDPANSRVEVPVSLHVTGVPDIEVATDSINFGPSLYDNTYVRSFIVHNKGDSELVVSSIVVTHSDYSVNLDAVVVPAGVEQVVEVSFLPSGHGDRNATLTISHDSPVDPPVEIALTGQGYHCGDADQNGVVEADDVAFLIQYYVMYGMQPPLLDAIDLTCNSVFGLNDIIALANYLNGSGPPPCCP